jgi:hypothetical protein
MRRRATTANAGEPSGLLEPDARKRARPVLRGPGRSNALGLPGELIGNYANGGGEWSPAGEPERTNVHDFADHALGEFAKAIPYGIYDVANDEGWVSVGDVADTAEFAVESIRRWWNQVGRARFPDADRLMITADAGGSNGYRLRAWKVHLARLAAETGLHITVCHYPPGTSK